MPGSQRSGPDGQTGQRLLRPTLWEEALGWDLMGEGPSGKVGMTLEGPQVQESATTPEAFPWVRWRGRLPCLRCVLTPMALPT